MNQYPLLSHILELLSNKDAQQKLKPKDWTADAVPNDGYISCPCESQIWRTWELDEIDSKAYQQAQSENW